MDEANKIIQELNDKIVALEAENYVLREKNVELEAEAAKAREEAEAIKCHYGRANKDMQDNYRDLKHHCDVLQAQVDIVKLIFG